VFNGADDNASGTAALLAIADHLRRNPPEHSVIIAALDAEESGLQGARAFVQDPPVAREAILANVNMDMLGRNDAGELWAAGTFHSPWLLPLVERVAQRAPVKLRIGHDRPGVAGQDDWTGASDHGPFHAAGIAFLYFGVEDHADYHRASDEAQGIQPDFYGRAVATVIDFLMELDAWEAAR
jgi:Zn-dependent M28 family amino/carboxypeptidase